MLLLLLLLYINCIWHRNNIIKMCSSLKLFSLHILKSWFYFHLIIINYSGEYVERQNEQKVKVVEAPEISRKEVKFE